MSHCVTGVAVRVTVGRIACHPFLNDIETFLGGVLRPRRVEGGRVEGGRALAQASRDLFSLFFVIFVDTKKMVEALQGSNSPKKNVLFTVKKWPHVKKAFKQG